MAGSREASDGPSTAVAGRTGPFGAGRTLVVELDGAGRGRVLVDGDDISDAVRGVEVRAEEGGPTSATLDLTVLDATRIESARTEVVMAGRVRDLLLAAGWTPPEGGDS
jgi:hypothetical protein